MVQKRIFNWLLRLRPAFLASFIKKIIFVKRIELKTSYGTFLIDLCSNFGRTLLLNGIYEPHMVKIIENCLGTGDIFVDLGSNEGYFSVIASKIVGDKGRVFAVEPQYRLKNIIEKNLQLNHCKNVRILPIAISDKNQEVNLYIHPDVNSGSSSLIRTTIYPLFKQRVKALTLSEIFREQEINECQLLKIDIEGWEYEAILCSPELFNGHRITAIALSLHPKHLLKRGLSGKKIVNFLFSCGYRTNDNLLYLYGS